jgi:hypothetical protein
MASKTGSQRLGLYDRVYTTGFIRLNLHGWVYKTGTDLSSMSAAAAYGYCLWVLPMGAAYGYRDREFMPHAFAQKELLDDTRSAIKKFASYLPRDVESAQ